MKTAERMLNCLFTMGDRDTCAQAFQEDGYVRVVFYFKDRQHGGNAKTVEHAKFAVNKFMGQKDATGNPIPASDATMNEALEYLAAAA